MNKVYAVAVMLLLAGRSMPDHWDLERSPWDKSPRFYPPGAHPATYRWRMQLQKLQELRERQRERGWPVPGETVALVACHQTQNAIDYLQDQLAAFEGGENEAKMRYYYWMREK